MVTKVFRLGPGGSSNLRVRKAESLEKGREEKEGVGKGEESRNVRLQSPARQEERDRGRRGGDERERPQPERRDRDASREREAASERRSGVSRGRSYWDEGGDVSVGDSGVYGAEDGLALPARAAGESEGRGCGLPKGGTTLLATPEKAPPGLT